LLISIGFMNPDRARASRSHDVLNRTCAQKHLFLMLKIYAIEFFSALIKHTIKIACFRKSSFERLPICS